MSEKSKRELKRKEKIKEENIKKLDEQIKSNKIISKDYKKKMNKQTIFNFLTIFTIVLYLFCLNISSIYTDTNIFLLMLKCFSILLAIISIIYFEIAYRKDNERLFLYGIEILVLGIATLFSNYIYYIYFNSFNKIITCFTLVFIIYYLVKIFIARRNMRKKYYNEQNDIKEIIKK